MSYDSTHLSVLCMVDAESLKIYGIHLRICRFHTRNSLSYTCEVLLFIIIPMYIVTNTFLTFKVSLFTNVTHLPIAPNH